MKPAQVQVLELCALGNHKSSYMAGTMALFRGGRNWVFLSHKGRAFLPHWGVGILSWRLWGGIEGFYYVYCWFSKSGRFDFFFRFWKQNSPKLRLKIQIKSNSFKSVEMKPTFKLVKIKWGWSLVSVTLPQIASPTPSKVIMGHRLWRCGVKLSVIFFQTKG